MLTLYTLCAVVGGALLLISLLGGHDHDLGLNTDHLEAGDIASWLSLRALVSFAAFFGLGGLLAIWLRLSGPGQLLFALVAGLSVGGFTAWAFRLARLRGETATRVGSLTGRTGRVLVSPRGAAPGKALLTVAGQREEWLVQSADPLSPGDRVLVIAQERGVLDVRLWDGQ
ncbi:hypothetical protein [Deinococcus sonorensis]|uniref:NfeD-like C-terminal domain-containing protein n=2 Tax=Deinococcus sonorensis TaxID=309891 RepID=A0AAU7UAZ3_9DEIO